MRTDRVHRAFHRSLSDFEVGLHLSLIATPLGDITVYTKDELSDVLSNPKFRGHGILLVNNEDEVGSLSAKYIGILEKDTCMRTGKVKDCGVRPFTACKIDYVEKDAQCAFIGDEDGASGLVAESDLQKPPVRILAFTLVTHLEWLLRRAIDVHVPDESRLAALLNRLNLRDWKHIDNNRRDDNKRGIERPLGEYTNLSQKIRVLKEVGFINEQDAQELRTIRDMRNALGHGYAHIHEFIPRLRKTIKWVDHLVTVPNLLG